MKVVINGDWVILREEDGENQILTSQESLETWIKVKEGNENP
jgi:predicted lipoprotein with Yx(FWY)xxD motif